MYNDIKTLLTISSYLEIIYRRLLFHYVWIGLKKQTINIDLDKVKIDYTEELVYIGDFKILAKCGIIRLEGLKGFTVITNKTFKTSNKYNVVFLKKNY